MTDTGEYIRYYNLIFSAGGVIERIVGCAGRSGRTVLLSDAGKEMQKMTQLLLELKRAGRKKAFWEKMSADLIEKICILILRKSPKKWQAKEEEIPEAVRRSLVLYGSITGKKSGCRMRRRRQDCRNRIFLPYSMPVWA